MQYLLLLLLFAYMGSIPSALQDANHRAYGRIQHADYFDGGRQVGAVRHPQLDEASGLAASRKHPGLLYSHNDSGDSARVFVMDATGQHKGIIRLAGARNKDWEEIALGPGPQPGTDYLYCADVGDNLRRRDSIVVYRLPEPEPSNYTPDRPFTTTAFERIVIRYEDGAHDCEGILVEPATRHLYLISKRDARSRLYVVRYPQNTAGPNVARYLFELPFTQVTAASTNTTGTEVIARTYGGIFYWGSPQVLPFDSLLRRPPVLLTYLRETQGEAVCFAPDGSGYYTLSEKATDPASRLLFYRRK